MPRRFALRALGLLVALLLGVVPARAARPIVDLHKLDAYFALFARDSNVPWEPTTVRLDTYSGAPVDFAAYAVDPGDVLTAGADTRPRAVDTRRLHPVVTWRFTPPGGYRFQSNEVRVPLGDREGFFVIEARRGSVGEQVWINRTRVGLISKETPSGILLYGTDLGTGRALAHMRVSFVVNSRFVVRYTDAHGIVRWDRHPRPVFALAQWGASTAFVSFLPQAPLPATIVGVKVDSAVVRAGNELHVVGFARSRAGNTLRPAAGTVQVSLRLRGAAVAQASARLDAAGAFVAALRVPPRAAAGSYVVLASLGGATAGTAVHVDADAGGLSLSVFAACHGPCDPQSDVPLVVRALRDGKPAAGVPVRVSVIRSPHVWLDDATPVSPWGITRWYETVARTNAQGRAQVAIPQPTDGLSSTYGVRASSGGATADTRVVVPTASVVLQLRLDRDQIGIGTPVAFTVRGLRTQNGEAASGMPVFVELIHGASVQQQRLTLDAQGRARGEFRAPEIGSNLVIARAQIGEESAMDAGQVDVEPQALEASAPSASGGVHIELDGQRFVPGDEVGVRVAASGAHGDALLTLESALGSQAQVVPVAGDLARARFVARDAPGALAIGAAYVRDGTLQWGTVALPLEAPGRPSTPALELDKTQYEPGAIALVRLARTAPGAGTAAVRVTRGQPSGSALFDTAPDLLAIGTTTTQDTAPGEPAWHPWVDSTGSHAQIITFERRSAPPQDLSVADAATQNEYWKVERDDGNRIRVPVPEKPGTYTLSILQMDDDGRVCAASANLVVR